jgi:hypothetical protein
MTGIFERREMNNEISNEIVKLTGEVCSLSQIFEKRNR